MLPRKVPLITIPLFQYIRKGEERATSYKRIRPVDALDLTCLIKEMKPSTITTRYINEHPWSVISVLSPYSTDFHVMVMETSSCRYIPGPEGVPDGEGEELMGLCRDVVKFIRRRGATETLCIGYNWSPRAWGGEEEKGGFQSVPTKWHTMIWTWPSFRENKDLKNMMRWVETNSLNQEMKRILGGNLYAEPMSQLILNEVHIKFSGDTFFSTWLDKSRWKIDGRGLEIKIPVSIEYMIKSSGFFSRFLKPIACLLDSIACQLSEIFTDMNCVKIDSILKKTELGSLSLQDISILRKAPVMRSHEEIQREIQNKGYPSSLLQAIKASVENRCSERGDRTNWWRKGFGYSLVFSASVGSESTVLRVMPGVFVGPGGVVEAQGIILQRPQNKQLNEHENKKKSRVLWELAEELENKDQAR